MPEPQPSAVAASGRSPSIIGSGCGFGMAGSAVGSLAGLVWFGFELGRLTPDQRVGVPATASYAYILLCIPVGFTLGVVAGVEYARWGRRRIARRHVQNSAGE